MLFLFIIITFSSSSSVKYRLHTAKNQLQDIRTTIAPVPTVYLAPSIPSAKLIQSTFVPQSPEKNWDEPWQDACEEASLLTVNYYYQQQNPSLGQIKQDLLAMFDYELAQGWSHDLNLNQMSYLANHYWSYTTQIIDNPSTADLVSHLAAGHPIIIPANGKILYRENHHFKDGGPYYHNLVILGYDYPQHQFIVHDVGTQYGAYFRYSFDTLIESIHDFPKSGLKQEINDGAKRALVLLK
jgi:hypothetical protein